MSLIVYLVCETKEIKIKQNELLDMGTLLLQDNQ